MIISRAHYLAIASIHLPRTPAPGAGGGAGGEGATGCPRTQQRGTSQSVPFRSGLGRKDTASRLFPMIVVWCSVLPIYISNLMAHKLLAEWFHYSPSVSYKGRREESGRKVEGVGEVGS